MQLDPNAIKQIREAESIDEDVAQINELDDIAQFFAVLIEIDKAQKNA